MRGSSSVVLVGVVCAVLAACGRNSTRFVDSDEAGGSAGSSGIADSSASAGTLSNGDGGRAHSSGGSAAGGTHGGTTSSSTGGTHSSGGGTAGGMLATSGGASATTGLPEPPANCTASSQSVTRDVCSFSYECGAIPFYSRCGSASNGAWDCFCATPSGAVMKELKLHDVDAKSACGVMAKACMTDAPAGERVCERTGDSFSTYECVIEENCGPTFELGSGVKANGVELHSVACHPDSDGKISCTCQPQNLGKQEHKLTAPSLQAACEAMIGVCRDGVVASAAPGICTDKLDTIETNACGMSRTCTRDIALGNDVSLTSTMTRYATCGSGDDVMSYCDCQLDSQPTFEFGADLGTGASPCRATLDACTGVTQVEPFGPIHCTFDGKTADAHACEAKLTCTRPLKVGTVEATGSGKLRFGCQQHDPGGPWWCACVAKGEPKIFELGAAPSAEDACYAAYDRCPKEVEVDFGPHGRLQDLPTLF